MRNNRNFDEFISLLQDDRDKLVNIKNQLRYILETIDTLKTPSYSGEYKNLLNSSVKASKRDTIDLFNNISMIYQCSLRLEKETKEKNLDRKMRELQADFIKLKDYMSSKLYL